MTRAEALGQGGCAMWMCDVHGAMRQTSTSQRGRIASASVNVNVNRGGVGSDWTRALALDGRCAAQQPRRA